MYYFAKSNEIIEALLIKSIIKHQVREWWGTRYAQGTRGLAGCTGMDFTTEARMSPGLALMKLSITVRGPEGLVGLLMWCKRKFTASPRTHLAKMLNLALIKSLDLTSSCQEMEGLNKQVKWQHQEATDKSRGWGALRDNCPSLFKSVKKRSVSYSRSRSTIDIWGQIILCHGVGGCPVHCRILSSIPGHHPLDASGTPLARCDDQRCLQTQPNVPGYIALEEQLTEWPGVPRLSTSRDK